jgi:transcriptional regulator with XRE-family HTH domain
MAHNSVSGYENGRTPLDAEMIEKFAKALEVSPTEIEVVSDRLNDAAPEYRAESPLEAISETRLSELVSDALAELKEATPERKKKLFRLIKEISGELERREPTKRPESNPAYRPLNSILPGEAATAIAQAERAAEIERETRSKPSPGAGGTSGQKSGSAQNTSGHPKGPQKPGGPARE